MQSSAVPSPIIPDARQLARFSLLDEKDREIWLEFFGMHYLQATMLFCKMAGKGVITDWEDWYYVVRGYEIDVFRPVRFDRENIQPLFAMLEDRLQNGR